MAWVVRDGAGHQAAEARASSANHAGGDDAGAPVSCPLYHEAVELVGRRWTGVIVDALLQRPNLRFSEIAQAVPEISDRLLSQRMRELEARGMLSREVHSGPPLRVEYSLTRMGRALGPALEELKAWAQHWLVDPDERRSPID
jgi:DNA-binding HxlR family transcriptional regulator